MAAAATATATAARSDGSGRGLSSSPSARAVDLAASSSGSSGSRRALLGWLSSLGSHDSSSSSSSSGPNLAESVRAAAYSEDVDNPHQRPLDEDLAAAFFRRAAALLSPGGRAGADVSSAREMAWTTSKKAQVAGSPAGAWAGGRPREDGERKNDSGGRGSSTTTAANANNQTPTNKNPANKFFPAPTDTVPSPPQPSVNYTFGTAGGRGDTTPPPLSPPEACVAPAYGRDLPARVPLSPHTGRDEAVPIPALPEGVKPNVIVVFMDDLGFDDASFRHPKGSPGEGRVRTPNLERLARQSVEFDNFYVEPMCSQTRATLLTGRDYPKTGALLINGGWDAISPSEKLLPEVMRAAGYSTTMAGKWHNSASQGYAPWDRGFEDAWYPTDHVHLDNNMRHGGEWVQTTGWMEPKLLDILMTSLDRFLPGGGGGGGEGRGKNQGGGGGAGKAVAAGEAAEPHVRSATGGPGGLPTRRRGLAQLSSVREEHAGNRADLAGRVPSEQRAAAKAGGVTLAAKKTQPASAGAAKETFGLIHGALHGGGAGGSSNNSNNKNAAAAGAKNAKNNNAPKKPADASSSPLLGVNTTADARPFFVYYAPFSIHQGVVKMGEGPRWQRPSPPEFLARQPEHSDDPRVSRDTRQVWAMLEAYDVQIGRLLDYLDATGLSNNTYVLFTADNGAALFQDEARPDYKPVRMPSKMAGFKEDALEGGVRQALYVRGPGVTPGRVESRPLLHIKDVVPTLTELATGSTEPPLALRAPWDGRSFANLLKGGNGGGSNKNAPVAPQPNDFQMNRAQVIMEPRCVGFDFVPALDPSTRRVAKPQPLFDYRSGGAGGLGWERCLAVRQGNYKLARGRLYKFAGGSHVEASCNAVTDPQEETEVKGRLQKTARDWFDAVVRDPNAFEKSPAFIGWGARRESNVLTNAAVERPAGRVTVQGAGVSGFERRGDAIAVRVVVEKAGEYEVRAYYQTKGSGAPLMTLSVGPYASTVAEEAPSWGRLTSTWPAREGGRGESAVGKVRLEATPPGEAWEMRLTLDSPVPGGGPAFASLDNVKFVLQGVVGADSPFEPTRDVEGAN